MDLSDNEARQFNRELAKFEEAREMPFVTSMERQGIKKGRVEGRVENARESVIRVLAMRFGFVPESITESIEGVDDVSKLTKLLEWAACAKSLKNFPLK